MPDRNHGRKDKSGPENYERQEYLPATSD